MATQPTKEYEALFAFILNPEVDTTTKLEILDRLLKKRLKLLSAQGIAEEACADAEAARVEYENALIEAGIPIDFPPIRILLKQAE